MQTFYWNVCLKKIYYVIEKNSIIIILHFKESLCAKICMFCSNLIYTLLARNAAQTWQELINFIKRKTEVNYFCIVLSEYY